MLVHNIITCVTRSYIYLYLITVDNIYVMLVSMMISICLLVKYFNLCNETL